MRHLLRTVTSLLFHEACLTLVRGYTIDDLSNSVQYSGFGWVHYKNQDSELPDDTFTHNICYAENDCRVKIPFTGSGITIFNDVTGPLNLSFAIDGSIPTPLVYNKAICSSPPYCHNIAIYDKQTLTNDNHILDIMIFSYGNVPSHFAFNGATVRTPTAAVAQPAILSYSPTAVPPSQRSHKSSTGIIIGAVLGGIAVIGLFVISLLILIRRNRHQDTWDIPLDNAPSPEFPSAGTVQTSQIITPPTFTQQDFNPYGQETMYNNSSAVPLNPAVPRTNYYWQYGQNLPLSEGTTSGYAWAPPGHSVPSSSRFSSTAVSSALPMAPMPEQRFMAPASGSSLHGKPGTRASNDASQAAHMQPRVQQSINEGGPDLKYQLDALATAAGLGGQHPDVPPPGYHE